MICAQGILAGIRDIPVYVKTFGCTYNVADSRKIIEVLKSQGCSIVNSPGQASAVVVNTCTVVAPTERKVLRYLEGLRAHRLYVTGCMPCVQMPEILHVCSPDFISQEEIDARYREVGTVPPGPVGIIQIAKGCKGKCTYCITRRARGTLKSLTLNEILGQVRQYIAAGAVEIQLTAQDTGWWGEDLQTDLSELLNAVTRLPGTFRVRVGMMNPEGLVGYCDRLIHSFQNEKIYSFIHLPLQSGSDRILSAMGRGYTSREFFSIVDAFRAELPEISIATDIIVGFPGETPEDVAASAKAIERIHPQKVNITRFSRRPGCESGKMDDYPDHLKKVRSRYLNAIADRSYREENARWIGRTVSVTVTEQLRDGSVISRMQNYRNVVIPADIPAGYAGYALLLEDHLHYFKGQLVKIPK